MDSEINSEDDQVAAEDEFEELKSAKTLDDTPNSLDKIDITLGDITNLEVEAIVNAAQNKLTGGGGVDGAIHEVAGPELYEECIKIGWCDFGDAKITKGYNLPAKYVIHTVGPMWGDTSRADEEKDKLLRDCYINSLKLAEEKGLKTIAFPSISTGFFHFPIDRAIPIAFNSVIGHLNQGSELESVIFVLFSQSDFDKYLDYRTKFEKEVE